MLLWRSQTARLLSTASASKIFANELISLYGPLSLRFSISCCTVLHFDAEYSAFFILREVG